MAFSSDCSSLSASRLSRLTRSRYWQSATVTKPMLNSFRLLLAAACTFLSSPATRAAPPEDWNTYRNERFGFSLLYPADVFAPDRTAQAGDGELMVSRDGSARLLIGGLINDDHRSPAAYQDYIARKSYADYRIDYRRLGSNWFVLSGEGNGRIFYEKVMFSCAGRLINSFALIYSANERHVFDPIVERIENSFRPGQNCEQAGLATPPPRREARRPGPSHTSRPTARSALADRIARSRGSDVIVVLRRTSPPYDYRIVRGYANRNDRGY